MSVAENIKKLRDLVPKNVDIVAVSKFQPTYKILEAYNTGQRLFGESRVQEFLQKKKELPSDIQWHFIGHLQTNKVKQIIGETSVIESVDSEKLLELIDKESQKAGVITKVLLQIHVANEETKFGFYPEEIKDYFQKHKFENLKSTKICGIMGMATNTDNKEKIREDFSILRSIYLSVKNERYIGLNDFNILSMGMSGDWEIAIEEGSNSIRIGSSIFGERAY